MSNNVSSHSSGQMSMDNDDTTTLPLNKDVLAKAVCMTNIERFFHLLYHAKLLVGQYGTYTKRHNTTVFSRNMRSPQRLKPQNPSLEDLAISLSAAQDCTYSAQPAGPAKDDLDLLTLLWDSAVMVLEEILARGSLPGESFGWGIFGLSAGYMHPPARDLTAQNLFSSNKYRLHAALCTMPSIDGRMSSEYIVSEKKTMEILTRARRDIHTLGHILLHEFRFCCWRRVRWLHTIAVAERWVGAFRLKPEMAIAPVERTKKVQQEKRIAEKRKVAKKHVTFKFPLSLRQVGTGCHTNGQCSHERNLEGLIM